MFTGGTIIFGAIDLFSSWDFIIKIKYKSDVPECIREVQRECKSRGVVVGRFHTDGENVFHSEEAHNATKTELDS